MDFIKKLKLIERIDGMISRKSTGSPAELAEKTGVSERTLYNIIAIMKTLGAPIYYSSSRVSYCYNGAVSFSYIFTVEDEVKLDVKEKVDVYRPSDYATKEVQHSNTSFTSTRGYLPSFRMRLEDHR